MNAERSTPIDPASVVCTPRRFFAEAYPVMRDIPSNLSGIERAGYIVAGHFVPPQRTWWQLYCGALERRLAKMRRRYPDVPEARQATARHQREIDLYRACADCYDYVFFVMQMP